MLLMIFCSLPVCAATVNVSNYNKGSYKIIKSNSADVGIPSNLKVKKKSSTALEITWTKVSNADGYILYSVIEVPSYLLFFQKLF